MKFCATATPMAAARPFEVPAPMPIAAVATVASMTESLSACSVTAPSVAMVLPLMTALAVLRMLLTDAAPPPAMARALLPVDAAIATLAATVVDRISASSEAVNRTEPLVDVLAVLLVTVEPAIVASTSLSISFNATEMPTAMAPALPPVETPTLIAPATASERIVALSAAVSATPPGPVAVTVLPLPIRAWMSLSMVFTAATPAPARAPAVLEPENPTAPEIVSASARIWSPVAAGSRLLSAMNSTLPAVNLERSSVARTVSSIVFSATATPTEPASAVPLAETPRATATAPAFAVTCALSVACRRATPVVASTVLSAMVAAMVCRIELDVPTPAPANAPVTPVLPLLPAAAPEPPAASA